MAGDTGDDLDAVVAEIPADGPEPLQPGRAGAEVGEQAIQAVERRPRRSAEGVADERFKRRRLDEGVHIVDGLFLRAVVGQMEETTFDPPDPARKPEAWLDAVVRGGEQPADVVAIDGETIREQAVAGPSDSPPRADVQAHPDEGVLEVEVEDPDIGFVQRAHRQPVRANRSPWEGLLEKVLLRLVGEERDGAVLKDLSWQGVQVADEGVTDQGGGEPKLVLQPHGLEGVAHVWGGRDERSGFDPCTLDTTEDVRGPVRRAEDGKLFAALVGQDAHADLGVIEFDGRDVEDELGGRGRVRRSRR